MWLTGVMVTGVLAVGLPACSSDTVAVQSSDAPIRIQTSQIDVEVENRAGVPLLDVTVALVVIGLPPFTHTIPRMEAADKRDLSLSQFSSDNTPFSLMQWKPRSVKVTATDLTKKPYAVEAPWK